MKKRKAPAKSHKQSNPKKRHRATRADLEKRIEYARELLGKGASKYYLHAEFWRKWRLAWKTVDDTYIAPARARLNEQAGKIKGEVRADAIEFYTNMLLSRKSTNREKFMARERLDKIFGVDSPVKTEITVPGGLGLTVAAEVKQVKEFDFEKLDAVQREVFGVASDDDPGQPLNTAHPIPETSAVPVPGGT